MNSEAKTIILDTTIKLLQMNKRFAKIRKVYRVSWDSVRVDFKERQAAMEFLIESHQRYSISNIQMRMVYLWPFA